MLYSFGYTVVCTLGPRLILNLREAYYAPYTEEFDEHWRRRVDVTVYTDDLSCEQRRSRLPYISRTEGQHIYIRDTPWRCPTLNLGWQRIKRSFLMLCTPQHHLQGSFDRRFSKDMTKPIIQPLRPTIAFHCDNTLVSKPETQWMAHPRCNFHEYSRLFLSRVATGRERADEFYRRFEASSILPVINCWATF